MVVPSPKALLGRGDAVSREGPEKMVVPRPKTVRKTVRKTVLGRWSAAVSFENLAIKVSRH